MKKEPPYNPLDKSHLAESTANGLLRRPVVELPPPDPFEGAGIYAIYYFGDFPAYLPIARRNQGGHFELLIYVGKADPEGGRRGGALDQDHGSKLYERLSKHARSIEQANNLQLSDFRCQYLVVDDVWIRMAERLLIAKYRPVWNIVVDGFGNNDPGGRRATQYRSPWDVLHPGRTWAEKLADSGVTQEQIAAKISRHLAGRAD